jgi:K319-like protein
MKMGKQGIAFYGFTSGLLLLAIGTLTPKSAQAEILSVSSNSVTIISPPPSAVGGAYSNGQIYIFPERTSFLLNTNVKVDVSNPGVVTNNFFFSPTNISAGTTVDSYFMHHGGSSTNTASGSVTFDRDVIGIICTSSNLVASHRVLGATGTTYQLTLGLQGYELGPNPPLDGIILSSDHRTITVSTVGLTGAPDDLRILTLPAPPPPLPPIAVAESNQVVFPGNTFVLVGFGSRDPNNPPLPLTYLWTQISGPPVTIDNPTSPFVFPTAPAVPDSGAVLIFQLQVSNGFASSSNIVSITVVGASNYPPIANAGPNQTVGENSPVTLDGSGSSDFNLDTLTLQWSQVSGPLVSITNADSVNPSFFAPTVAGAPVTLKFQLIVDDGKVNSGPSFVTITVTNIVDVPIANAGTNQTVNELSPVTLDGTASSDPAAKPLTYSWTQILGTHVTLAGANTATPSFTSPSLGGGGTNGSTTLTFRLSVSNGETNSSSTVNVLVNNVNHDPVAVALLDQTLPPGLFVPLIGTNSFDPDNDPLTYSWVQISGPTVTLNNANTGSAFFVTPNVGPSGATLIFELTVSDGFGGVATDDVTINVIFVNHPPVASAGTNQTVNEGSLVTLAGTASDPDGNDLTIQWTEIVGPSVTLINPTTLTPSFIAPSVTRAETNVILQLTADDGFGGIVTSNVTVHIANVNHAPVAQAPANLVVPEATLVQLVGQGTDPDTEEQSQLAYSWAQIAGPSVSIDGSAANISFTSPLVSGGGDTNASVTLTFALTVTDPNGAAGTNSVNVVVANVDHAPTAVAGNNLTVNEGSSVTLNGSASSDPDSDPLTYSWVQISGPTVTLVDANTALPEFTAPFVNIAGATLQFQLTVNDGFGGTSTATTTVTVNNINDPPNVDHAQPSVSTLWPPNHHMVSISIIGVIDPNNNATINITGVTQDEPTNGTGGGDTDVDAIINSDGTVLLRAERADGGNGRVYHIHFTASDFEGSASGVVNVSVPQNKKDTAIDDGELYDSTQ